MDNSINILKENMIVSVVVKDEHGKVLVCKHEHTGAKFSLPIIEVRHFTSNNTGVEWKDYMKQLIALMAKEFGIKIRNFNFIANDRMVYKRDGVYIMGDHLSYMGTVDKPHKGSTLPTPEPSGVYSELQYMEMSEIEDKFKKQQFDSSTFCALFACNMKYAQNKSVSKKDEFESLLGTDPVVSILYQNEEGKFMLARHKFNGNKLALPICRPVILTTDLPEGKATDRDIFTQVTKVFRGEFGFNPADVGFYESSKVVYYYFNNATYAHHFCFDAVPRGEYHGKPEIIKNPSGEYSDIRWVTLEEIVALREAELFDDLSFYFVLRRIQKGDPARNGNLANTGTDIK
ncbi:MAG: hypothetical protein ACRC0G_09675 [Fusobacteriaceae bacterium]